MKKTNNYSIFQYVNGNRDINPGHVRKLVQSISKQNLLEFNPIMVGSDMVIIDGQHRLAAAKELGLPIYYNQVTGDLDTVILMNNNSKNWSVSDFVNSYIELGNENYQILKDFKQKWGVAYTTATRLLAGVKINDAGGRTEDLRNGDFKVDPNNNAEQLMVWIDSFSDFADAVIRRNRSFISAVEELVSKGEITKAGLKHKLEVAGKLLFRQNTKQDYLRQLESIINYKSRAKIRLY